MHKIIITSPMQSFLETTQIWVNIKAKTLSITTMSTHLTSFLTLKGCRIHKPPNTSMIKHNLKSPTIPMKLPFLKDMSYTILYWHHIFWLFCWDLFIWQLFSFKIKRSLTFKWSNPYHETNICFQHWAMITPCELSILKLGCLELLPEE